METSVEFTWNTEDFDALLESCRMDDSVAITVAHLPADRNAKILEAGCGLGRVVKYLHELGYKNACGIELNREAADFAAKRYPELNVIPGDILNMPYPDNCFDMVVSYGVVEHFIYSMQRPLIALREKLKPGGIAIITVPSFNLTRQLKYAVRRLVGKLSNRPGRDFLFNVDPPNGKFFEYRLKKREFEQQCRQAGFTIIRSLPIAHIDGFYHEYSKQLVRFNSWQFEVNPAVKPVEKMMRIVPFLHNHMHACVLTK